MMTMRHTITTTLRLAATLGLLAAVAAPALCQDRGDKPKKTEATPEDRRASFERLFERLDKNRDNVLKIKELENAEAWLNRFDSNGDDEIRKKEYFSIVDRGPGLDRLFIIRDPRARALNARRQFDQDKNGVVSAEEYPGDKNAFKDADRNKDGELEWKELLRLAGDEIDDIRRRMKSPSRYEFLGLFDVNYDRKVSQAEYDGPARAFRKYDENADGTVDYYEIYPERMMEMEEAKPVAQDFNVITALDKNQDSKVSREEFKGTTAAWNRLDRNKDGWITVADAR